MRRPWILNVVLLFALPVLVNVATTSLPHRVMEWSWAAWPLGLGLTCFAIRQERRQAAQPIPRASVLLSRSVAVLRDVVREQWGVEVSRRGVNPQLRVSWSGTDRPVAVRAEAVVGVTPAGGPVRLRLHGDLGEAADRLLRMAPRAVAVLGEPGAGKTTMAMMLTLELIDHPDMPADSITVLLSLASWRPANDSLEQWVAIRLAAEYPELADPTRFGPDAAGRLVRSRALYLVLDGLDEMPAETLGQALDAIGKGLDAFRCVIVTCRTAEYETAVETHGIVLRSAAVVELNPVQIPDAEWFIASSLVDRDDRWAPVFRSLRADPTSPAVAALTTPLMVTLASAAYRSPSTDPAELVDRSRFGNRASVEVHLLDGFLTAAYAPQPATLPAPGGSAPRPYRPDNAMAWLDRIAMVARANAGDITWWRLYRSPRQARQLVSLTTALCIALTAGIPFVLIRHDLPLLVPLFAIGGAVVVWLSGMPDRPVHLDLAAVRPADLARAVGPAFGFAALAFVAAIDPSAPALAVPQGCVLALFTFPLGNPGGRILQRLRSHLDPSRTHDLRSTVKDDRTAALLRGLTLGLSSGWVLGLLYGLGVQGGNGFTGLPSEPKTGVAGGLSLAATVFCTLALGRSCWGWFTICHFWAAARRHLPWSLLAFLEDARDRGVLRRSGLAYQFRHTAIQQRLIRTGQAAKTPPTSAAPTP
jgi:hypothetical protein